MRFPICWSWTSVSQTGFQLTPLHLYFSWYIFAFFLTFNRRLSIKSYRSYISKTSSWSFLISLSLIISCSWYDFSSLYWPTSRRDGSTSSKIHLSSSSAFGFVLLQSNLRTPTSEINIVSDFHYNGTSFISDLNSPHFFHVSGRTLKHISFGY